MVKLFPKDAWTQRYLLISWISEVNTSEQTRSAYWESLISFDMKDSTHRLETG